MREDGDVVAVAQAGEHVKPTARRKEIYVFSEGGEDAAGKKLGDFFGREAPFKVAGQQSELCGDFASDASSVAGWIEGKRVEPNGTKAVADFWLIELREKDAVGARIGEREIGLAGEGEIGEELDGVTDIDGDEEWRPTFQWRQGLGVTFGLVVSLEHFFVPTHRAPNGGAETAADGTGCRCGQGEFAIRIRRRVSFWRIAALLCFKDEVCALVEVDTPGGCGAVEVVKSDCFLKDVAVAVIFCDCRLGAGNFKEVTQFRKEESVVRSFGRGRVLPSLNEALVRRRHKRMFS